MPSIKCRISLSRVNILISIRMNTYISVTIRAGTIKFDDYVSYSYTQLQFVLEFNHALFRPMQIDKNRI